MQRATAQRTWTRYVTDRATMAFRVATISSPGRQLQHVRPVDGADGAQAAHQQGAADPLPPHDRPPGPEHTPPVGCP